MSKPSNNSSELEELSIKDYIESAYLHGLCVENLDTGELEPPRDISDVQWIVDKIESIIAKEVLEGQNKLLDRIEREVIGKSDEWVAPTTKRRTYKEIAWYAKQGLRNDQQEAIKTLREGL